MKVNTIYVSNQTNKVQPSQNQAYDNVLKQLIRTNQSFVNVFNNDQFKSDVLTKKHAASLYNKMCSFLDQGTTEDRNLKKERLSFVYRDFIAKFIHQHILQSLRKCHQDEDFMSCLIQKWEQFKKFCYFYTFLLRAAESHYEQSYKSYKNQGKANKINNQDSIFPIAVISVHYFEMFVYNKYKEQTTKIIRQMLSQEREGKNINKQSLQSLFQIVYSCGLAELARIDAVKNNSNQTTFQFHLSHNKQIEKQFTNAHKNANQSFFTNILISIIEDCEIYYKNLFEQKISKFGPHQDFITVNNILQKQQGISQYYFFNHQQKQQYLNKIKQIIVVNNLQERLTKENSLKFCLQKFDSDSNQYLNEIKIFVNSIFKTKNQSLKILQNVVKVHLIQNGSKLNQKIGKRKQYMAEIVSLKKSINRIIDEAMHKNLDICVVRDECFKKILDSIQASRSLAQFTDLKIKQCIKNKTSQAEFIQKTKDIFLILQNLVAIDSFLIYHQQLLSRRLLQPLNQPKLDIEKFILRKIAEKFGNLTISVHTLMIKDIEKSIQLTDNFSKKIPFARFKFTCKILSPAYWPQNMNKNALQIVLPQAIRIQAQTITEHYQKQFTRTLHWKVDKGSSLFQGLFKTGKFRFQSQNIFFIILLHISEGKNHQIRFWQLLQKIIKQKQGTINHIMKCIKVLIQNGLVLRSNQNPNENILQGELLSIKMEFHPGANYKPNQPIFIKPSSQMQKAMHETTVEHNKIMKQRQKVVEAVLVKLLKHSHSTGTNKMTYQQLVKGVREYDHLKKFDISQGTIKQRIEQIIARGYCERNANDRKIFHYIA